MSRPGRPAGAKNKKELSDKARVLGLMQKIDGALSKLAAKYGRAGLDLVEGNLTLAKGELSIAIGATRDLADDFKFPRGTAVRFAPGSTVQLKAEHADLYDGLLPSGDLKVVQANGKYVTLEGAGCKVVLPAAHVVRTDAAPVATPVTSAASEAVDKAPVEQDAAQNVPDLDL